ncbi:hypothetical protein ACFX2J_023214 [Malus domestica]
MCDEIKQLTDEEMRDGLVYEAVYSAVQNGIVEVVIHLCQARPELLFRGLENGKNIFHYAVECRQENVYSLIYGVDAISLFSSATSVLMFLSILTSRYAEDDFLKSLPRQMIIGLSTFFISIATMMVAFSSALFIMLQDKPWITYPIIFLASVPVILFVWMQFSLLDNFFMSTYGGGIFYRKVKRWI